MKLSIIIPHYNGKELLFNCLESILNQISIQDYEIIVVDNASIDNSADKAKEKFPLINLLKSEINLGYSGGCNFGAKNANGEYIIFLNNDTVHTNNWIEELISFLDKNPQAGVAQPKILNATNRDTFDYAGGAGGYIDKYCFPFVRGRIFNFLEKDRNQYDDTKKIFWASGAAFIIRTDLFKEFAKSMDIPQKKSDAHELESGIIGLTNFVRSKNLDVNICDLSGRLLPPQEWSRGNFFRAGSQKNLLIEDNQTNAYNEANIAKKHFMEYKSWHKIFR